VPPTVGHGRQVSGKNIAVSRILFLELLLKVTFVALSISDLNGGLAVGISRRRICSSFKEGLNVWATRSSPSSPIPLPLRF
jgi:hypothetical protein